MTTNLPSRWRRGADDCAGLRGVALRRSRRERAPRCMTSDPLPGHYRQQRGCCQKPSLYDLPSAGRAVTRNNPIIGFFGRKGKKEKRLPTRCGTWPFSAQFEAPRRNRPISHQSHPRDGPPSQRPIGVTRNPSKRSLLEELPLYKNKASTGAPFRGPPLCWKRTATNVRPPARVRRMSQPTCSGWKVIALVEVNLNSVQNSQPSKQALLSGTPDAIAPVSTACQWNCGKFA